MFVPVPTGSPGAVQQGRGADESRDMAVALRLLSGKDCERDAARAHVMLVGLSESRDAVIREEAGRILKAGKANKWFTERTPKHYELERIAEKTLARRASEPARRRQALAIMLGLAVFMGGVVAYFVAADAGDIDWTNVPIVILTMILLLGVVFMLKLQRRG